MSAPAPEVSVVVSTRDRADRLEALLRALREQTLGVSRFEVVVVDNGSVDATQELLEREAASSPYKLVTLTRERGDGPAAARNQGWQAARAPLIAFTDDDCEPTPEWLQQGVGALARADLVQGSVRPERDVIPGPFDRTLWIDHETGFYETANLFVRREVLERVGGFEPLIRSEVERVIGEDVWLGWRARRAGASTAFCDPARVHHAVIGRRALELIGERRRLRHFPEIARRVPEIRERFLARIFLSNRNAQFDLALAGAFVAIRRRSLWPLLAMLPYVGTIARRAAPMGTAAPTVAVTEAAADIVGLASLVQGSVRQRTLVL